jgi:hypothetical protein
MPERIRELMFGRRERKRGDRDPDSRPPHSCRGGGALRDSLGRLVTDLAFLGFKVEAR